MGLVLRPTEKQLPLNIPKDASKSIQDAFAAIIQNLKIDKGITGNPLDKVVTFRDIVDLNSGKPFTVRYTPIKKAYAYMTGDLIRAGKIVSTDEYTYFDLNYKRLVFNAKHMYGSTMPGVFIGLDPEDKRYKLDIGHLHQYFKFNGTQISFKGTNCELAEDGTFRLINSNGDVLFEAGPDQEDKPYVSGYADHNAIELELMKINFQNISWAQFAVYDSFLDDSKRANPEPGAYPARLFRSCLDNGGNVTASRTFVFTSKTYSGITTVETGTSTGVGVESLTDSTKNWYVNECKYLALVDSAGDTFWVLSNTHDTLTLAMGSPAPGAYILKDDNPLYAVAFCTFLDSTNGGYGYVKMEVSFDGGSHYQTFLDTETSVDLRGATVEINYTGTDYIVRLSLKNDLSGEGPEVYNFLACTDPSPWRF